MTIISKIKLPKLLYTTKLKKTNIEFDPLNPNLNWTCDKKFENLSLENKIGDPARMPTKHFVKVMFT